MRRDGNPTQKREYQKLGGRQASNFPQRTGNFNPNFGNIGAGIGWTLVAG